MSKTGRYFVYDFFTKKLEKVVEPISKYPNRNANWTNGGIDKIKGGAITEKESIIIENNGFDPTKIKTLGIGESPNY